MLKVLKPRQRLAFVGRQLPCLQEHGPAPRHGLEAACENPDPRGCAANLRLVLSLRDQAAWRERSWCRPGSSTTTVARLTETDNPGAVAWEDGTKR